MIEEFQNKIRNNEYISQRLYLYISKFYPNIINKDFNIDVYNEKILEANMNKYANYFDNMFKNIDENITLDKDQIKAILADEDYSLVLAGAGTGKTTTLAAKVKYLVDIKKVDPSKILIMSYTKKATQELEKRIFLDFSIPAKILTFHSLGYLYIRHIFNDRKCLVVDDNLKNQIFLQYFKDEIFPNKNKVKEILDIFKINNNSVFFNHFINNYMNYNKYEDYLEKYKQDKLLEVEDIEKIVNDKIDVLINAEEPRTIKNEFVKSKGEAIIANFLFCNNIEYHYEKVYSELMDNNYTPYRPDFTIFYAGETIYIEYFGLSTYTEDKLNRYQKIKQIKENYHRKHHTKFIKLDYQKNENIIENLKSQLKEFNIPLKPKTYKEIYFQLLDNNPLSQIFIYKNFLYNMIERIKCNPNRNKYLEIVNNYIKSKPENLRKNFYRQFSYINEFYLYYQKKLYGGIDYYFDFSDMLYYANSYIKSVNLKQLEFDYILIDEYQDISQEKYKLTKEIANKNNAKLIAFGDDWQSIFSFTGSKIKYIYDFNKYYQGAKLFKINHTYRNSQELINYTGKFIMKNNKQIKKDLYSYKNNNDPIKFVLFKEDEEYLKLKETILNIHKEHPEHNILVLARTNKMIKKCYDDPDLIDSIGTKVKFIGYDDLDIDAMTIHKSKGLTSDEVIIIGLNQNFPNDNYNDFWFDYLFKFTLENENYPYAEERRIFYVALTRTKNNVYLLVNENPLHRSFFISELYRCIKEVNISNN